MAGPLYPTEPGELEPVEDPLSLADEPPLAPHRQWGRMVAAQKQQMEQERLHRLDQDVVCACAADDRLTNRP